MNGGDYAGGYGPANTGSTTNLKMGWGTSGKLATGNTSKMVTLQADFPISETYTIEFAKTNNPASNNPIFAEALITWSVEGNYVTRRVNIGDGVSLTGVGQAIKVQMTDATVAGRGGEPNASEYLVSCQVAPGVRPTTEQGPTLTPQTTVPSSLNGGGGLFTVGPGATVVVPISQDAGVIAMKVMAIDTTTNTLAARGLTVKQLYAGVTVKQYDPALTDDWVPVTPGTDQIALVNHTAHTLDVSPVFEIDG